MFIISFVVQRLDNLATHPHLQHWGLIESERIKMVELGWEFFLSSEAKTHTNHVDFKPIYRKGSMPLYLRVFWKEASLSCYCKPV